MLANKRKKYGRNDGNPHITNDSGRGDPLAISTKSTRDHYHRCRHGRNNGYQETFRDTHIPMQCHAHKIEQ